MSAIETAVISIIAGASGGLFGPYLSHWLDFLRRGQLRADERRRENREMLLAYMQVATTNRTTLGACLIGGADNDPKGFVERYQSFIGQIWQTYPYFFWRSSRIKDGELRVLAIELQKANGEAGGLLTQLFMQGGRKPERWYISASDSMDRIQKVIDAVDDRLEEMDW